MVLAGVVAFGLLAGPPVVVGGLRTAVISVGDDELAAGALQRDLEQAIARVPGVTLVATSSAAVALAGTVLNPQMPVPDTTRQAEWDESFKRVDRLYLEDRIPEALQKLQEISESHDRTAFVPAAERVRLLLWRATVLFAKGDNVGTESRVRAALVIDPDLVIGSTFPPSIAEFAVAVRAEGFRKVRLVVGGLPGSAVVKVDGRPLPKDGRIPAGWHRVAAWAPGFRWAEIGVEADVDKALTLSLPLAPRDDVERRLRRTALAGPDDVPDDEILRELARTIGADALVIATRIGRTTAADPCAPGDAAAPAPRRAEGRFAAVLWRTGRLRRLVPAPRFADTTEGSRQLASWLGDTLRTASNGFFSTIGTTLVTSIGPEARFSRTSDASRNGYDLALFGATTTIGVQFAPGVWIAELEGSGYLYGSTAQYADSRTSELEPERGIRKDGKVGGGGGWRVRAGAGRRFLLLGTSFDRGLWASGKLIGGWEHRGSEDLEDGDGNSLGFFPSYQRVIAGGEVRVGAGIPRTTLEVELATNSGWSNWWEVPSGQGKSTLGRQPQSDPAFGGELLLGWRRRDVRLVGSLRAERQSVAFSGRTRAPVEPRIRDARMEEAVFMSLVRVEWRP